MSRSVAHLATDVADLETISIPGLPGLVKATASAHAGDRSCQVTACTARHTASATWLPRHHAEGVGGKGLVHRRERHGLGDVYRADARAVDDRVQVVSGVQLGTNAGRDTLAHSSLSRGLA